MLAWEQGWVEFKFTPKLLMSLSVGFQILNATLKALNLIFLIKDAMNFSFFSLKHMK